MFTFRTVQKKTALRFVVAGAAALALSLGFVPNASASNLELEACGGALLETAASCVVLPTATCTTHCEPAAMEQTCAYRLTSTCEGQCVATAEVDCQSGCETSCVPTCTTEATPNCVNLCVTDCQLDCSTTCTGSSNPRCGTCCSHVCSRNCEEECAGATQTECTSTCTTACGGSCDARANIDCQVSCQSDAFVECETQLVQECRTNCEVNGGGIVCDGQVLVTDTLQECANAIEAAMNIHLDLSITIEGSIDAKASGGCSASPQDGPGPSLLGGFALLLGLSARRMFRRRR